MESARGSGFGLLWAGQTASVVGGQIGDVSVRLLAATALAATPLQLGLLSAAQTIGFLLIALPAGVLADRVRRRPVLITSNLLRAGLLALVPLLWWLDVLTLPQLLAVVVLAGLAQVVFDVTYQSYVPALVGRAGLVTANGRLESTRSTAVAAGPALGGVLSQALGAVNAIFLTSVGYLASAFLLSRIRAVEERPARPEARSLRGEIAEGLKFVLGNKLLRATTVAATVFNFSYGITQPLVIVLLVRELVLTEAAVGAMLALAGAGGLVGALVAGKVADKIGRSRAIWVSELACVPAFLLLPLTFPGRGLAFFAVGYFLMHLILSVFNVSNLSFRQAICPDRLLGRMNASVRFLMWGALPLGGVTGGFLGTALGTRWALVAAGAGFLLAALVLLVSPLRRLRDLPETVAA
ncbi:putative MFS family arabinose efflux permease [Saccharothrix saharensis]|uniref:Putative MFS family arabinose efflux permease n=1 Tax=Saccharothrix saharensis TaxID=571190 RepID=A0A543J8T8_9PSEU|nr:MFS transporter [Saccharothrix saharensis]TQM79242.1 putative MFS family arabinose efflux permease [Saccharothrix saharensis]